MPVPSLLADTDDAAIIAALEAHPTLAESAAALGIGRSTLRRELLRRGLREPTRTSPVSKSPRKKLTLEALHAAMRPPNTCRVKAFMETLDEDERDVFEEALSYRPQDCSARTLRVLMIELGCADRDVPGTDAITDHRAGRGRCRCKG